MPDDGARLPRCRLLGKSGPARSTAVIGAEKPRHKPKRFQLFEDGVVPEQDAPQKTKIRGMG